MKKMKKFLSAVLTIALVATMFSSVVLAMPSGLGDINADDVVEEGTGVAAIATTVLGFITFAAWAIAIGMAIFIGIKYMLSGAGKKAEVKDTILPYLIGAICVGAASSIATFAIGLGGKAE